MDQDLAMKLTGPLSYIRGCCLIFFLNVKIMVAIIFLKCDLKKKDPKILNSTSLFENEKILKNTCLVKNIVYHHHLFTFFWSIFFGFVASIGENSSTSLK